MTRYDFLWIFDAQRANPNGDPDAGNRPRIDSATRRAIVSDACLKRKIRNYVHIKHRDAAGYRIYFRDDGAFNERPPRAWKPIGEKNGRKRPAEPAADRMLKDFLCRNFYDIRTFGAVMNTAVNGGQLRGPVQLSFAMSADPVRTREYTIIRDSVTNGRDAEKERTMGRKYAIDYGLFAVRGTVNPFFAERTGFSGEDLELFCESLERAFEFDVSAARPPGSMNTRKVFLFRHEHALGDAPAYRLFEQVRVARRSEAAPRSFDDYEISCDRAALPPGISLEER